MDCNKEEALRAKDIAEKKLQNKDFLGARKIALKAQQLFPDLENISQMLMVCHVHCSAEKKFGNEMDWYGILQVEQAADEATIKKQYRKFALSLHPDKNKFSGAEAAFKLIGEAQRVLLDRDKRSAHNMKRKASMSRPTPRASSTRSSAPYQPPQKANQNPNVGFQNTTTNVFSGLNPQQQPAQFGFSNGCQTFWTACPFCHVRYQYYREIIYKSLACPNCQKTFLACEVNVPGATPISNMYMPTFQHQKVFPDQGACKVQVGCKRTSTSENNKSDILRKTQACQERRSKKRGRRPKDESSESCDTSNSSDSDDESVICEDGDFQGRDSSSNEHVLRRSTRQKQKVSYKENVSDDEDVNPPKGSDGNRLSSSSRDDNVDASLEETSNLVGKDGLATKLNEGKKGPKWTDNDCSGGMEEPEFHDYPDPDFNDFSKDRKEDLFCTGQVWAAYDTLDGMPRFYALIRRVYTASFQVQITWLEPDPDDVNEISWSKEGLPVSCGKFKTGHTEKTKNRLMFSHVVFWEKGNCKETYKVHPQVGETWALFKNWDINWHSDPGNHKKFEYDIVEILSEYVEGFGIRVAYLGKVKGFVSLFSRSVKGGISLFQIHANELYRFSHRVPSYRMTGDEREGVPKGSFELDPASMPMNLEESVPPEDPKVNDNGIHCKAACYVTPDGLKSHKRFEEKFDRADMKEECSDLKDCSSVKHNENSGAVPSNYIEIAEPEFYDFDNAKSPKNFQVGQVWALYSDEESLPKYYARIMNVHHQPEFKLQLKWMSGPRLPSDVIMWHDKKMPICCGEFRIMRNEAPHSYTSTDSFSHCLKVERWCSGKTERFSIFPDKGEVWALYKNWSPGMKYSGLKNCAYDVVEVVEQDDSCFEVVALELVKGFHSVFRPQVRWESNQMFEIPKIELMRFSHQVPAFRLTEERNGSLRGFWELDPAALPLYFFNSK